MTDLGYLFEICRLAALIYVPCVLYLWVPAPSMMSKLKMDMLAAFRAKQKICNDKITNSQSVILMWALFIGGLVSENVDEDHWFAQRIARFARDTGIVTWAQMEDRLLDIGWIKSLQTPTSKKLWMTIETLNSHFWTDPVIGAVEGP